MKKAHWTVMAFIIAVVASGMGAGCDQSKAQAQQLGVGTNAATAPGRASVTKIVFVGKEHACDCTRTRVDDVWKVLQEALGKPPKLSVERLQIDTQAEKVAPYRKQRPMMALPALYFLDAKGKVVELLQGEVTKGQVVTALGPAAQK